MYVYQELLARAILQHARRRGLHAGRLLAHELIGELARLRRPAALVGDGVVHALHRGERLGARRAPQRL